MAMNLIKLCVGADSVEDHRAWIDFRLHQARAIGVAAEQFHTTRMYPKRADEIIGQGSLYWVIKGQVQCRQRVLDIRRFTDNEGVSRCKIVLEPELILTSLQPKRPFQGWRYLRPEDAPRDMADISGDGEPMPDEMRMELSELGLI
ncbi:MAG: DUF1489 family protein [Ahrensia sp.]